MGGQPAKPATLKKSPNSKNIIKKKIAIKELGKPKFILNMRISHDLENKTIHLCQQQHIATVLKSAGLTECKMKNNPCPSDDISKPLDGTEEKPLCKEEDSSYDARDKGSKVHQYTTKCTMQTGVKETDRDSLPETGDKRQTSRTKE